MAFTDDPERIITPNIYADVPMFVIADTKGAYICEYAERFSERGYSIVTADPMSRNCIVMKDDSTASIPFSGLDLNKNGKTAIFFSAAEEEQSRELLADLSEKVHDATVFIDNIVIDDIAEKIRTAKDSRTTIIYISKDTAENEKITESCRIIWSDYSLKDKIGIYNEADKKKKKILDKAECIFMNGKTVYVDGYAA